MKIGERFKKGKSNQVDVEKTEKRSRKTKVQTPEDGKSWAGYVFEKGGYNGGD